MLVSPKIHAFHKQTINMKTTNWYLQTKDRMHCFLIKIESENTTRCTFNENMAMKFVSKQDALKFSLENKIAKQFKPIEL